MFDPVTISAAVATASTAFNGIKRAFQAGRDLESMTQDLSRWMGAVSDVDAMSISATGIVTFSQIPSLPINSIEISTQTRGAFLVIESGGTDGAGANAGDNIIDETDSDDIIHESATDLVGSVFNIIDSAGMVVRTINSV